MKTVIAMIMMAGAVWGEAITNQIGTETTNTSAWNFVVDAKHLTKEERAAFNARANVARLYGGVNTVVYEVQMLDRLREIEAIYEQAASYALGLGTSPVNISISNATDALIADTNYPSYSLEAMREHGVTNIVKTLAEAGEVCRVYRHSWRDGRPGESDTVRYADYHPGVFYRTCRICGKVQSETEGWE